MKILVIFTGGTIGSTLSGEFISPDADKPYRLIELYKKKTDSRILMDTIEPYTILSENADCVTYEKLYECVKENLNKDYDGIIITHGSDTLQYTAAMLNYVLGNDTIPIMLVASNYVLEDGRSNGLDNFTHAVDFIENHYGRGVFVPYVNAGEECAVHRGNRLMPHLPYSDLLYSIDNEPYGRYDKDRFIYNDTIRIPDGDEDIYEFPKNVNEKSGILSLHVCPGMIFPEIPDGTKAILLTSYHSGTLCTASEDFKAFMEKAVKNKIPVFLTGAVSGPDYESCSVYDSLGIKVLPKISPVAAYIRLWLETHTEKPFGMEKPVAGDYSSSQRV